MMKTATLVALLAVVGGSLADYCKICANHTMCLYTQDPGPVCNPLLQSGVNDEQRQEILDAHNMYRARVANGEEVPEDDDDDEDDYKKRADPNDAQPPASNMRKLSWDEELASIAQRWVDQCMYGHDDCKNVKRFSVGQNIALVGSPRNNQKITWSSTVSMWHSEVDDFDKADVGSFSLNYDTGHYTQLVWAETYLVGCGVSMYPNASEFIAFYACDYGPTGNVNGEPLYLVGEACSACPDGTSCEGGLCA